MYGRAAHPVLERNQKRKYRNIGPPLVLPLFYFLFHRVGVWLGGHIQGGISAPQLLLSGNTLADIPQAVSYHLLSHPRFSGVDKDNELS